MLRGQYLVLGMTLLNNSEEFLNKDLGLLSLVGSCFSGSCCGTEGVLIWMVVLLYTLISQGPFIR